MSEVKAVEPEEPVLERVKSSPLKAVAVEERTKAVPVVRELAVMVAASVVVSSLVRDSSPLVKVKSPSVKLKSPLVRVKTLVPSPMAAPLMVTPPVPETVRSFLESVSLRMVKEEASALIE